MFCIACKDASILIIAVQINTHFNGLLFVDKLAYNHCWSINETFSD